MKCKAREDFIKQVETLFPNKFDFSKTVYINSKTKVKLICKECKEEWIPFKNLENEIMNFPSSPPLLRYSLYSFAVSLSVLIP